MRSDLLIFGRPLSRSRKKWIESSRYMLHNKSTKFVLHFPQRYNIDHFQREKVT
jgi:hypothetical protein